MAALYVLRNEQTNRLTVVHVYRETEGVPQGLDEQLQLIDKLYPSSTLVSIVGPKGMSRGSATP